MSSRGVNKVILVGNLGQDPEIRYMPNGSAVANISLATSETWKDKQSGQQQEKTEWHRVVLFQKLAEIVGECCRKGSQIYIEGKLQTRKWTDQQGQEKYTTEIVVDGFDGKLQLLGGKSDNQQSGQSPGGYQGGQQQTSNQQQGGYGAQQQQQSAPQKNSYQQAQTIKAVKNKHHNNKADIIPHSNSGGPSNPMEPPMDFDDDIPFAPIGLQYPALLMCM